MREKIRPILTRKFVLYLILLMVAGMIYLPGMREIGYYRDDWNNVYNAFTQGAEMLIRHYASDRPADGYLLSWVYTLFGPDPFPYLLYNFACRFLSALCFFETLILIWPRRRGAAFCAAAFFLIFPGYLRQVDGIAYLPHQLAMLSICASIWLSIFIFQIKKRSLQVLSGFFSVLLALIEMFLMEYYIGLEALRFFLIGLYIYNHSQKTIFQTIRKTVLVFLPWLAGAAIFFYWRSFLFEASRHGTDVESVLTPLFQHPKYVGLSLLAKLIKNTAKIIFGSWTVPPYNVLNGTNVKDFWPAVVLASAAVFLFLVPFFGLIRQEKKAVLNHGMEELQDKKISWQIQWLFAGFFSVVLTITPLILAEREITFSSSLDRFAYPGSLCAILFILGLIGLISVEWVKTVLIALMVLTAVMTQRINQQNHILQTRLTKDFWWQLSWRAPDISEYTLVIANPGGFSPEEDYEVFSPINLIYYPERDHTAVGSEVLNTGSIRNAQMGLVTDRTVREIYVWKDYNNLLALTKPTEKSCLQVIDGSNPVYSPDEWSKIVEIGSYSKIDRIIPDAEAHIPAQAFFGEEPEHGWCYYYEKMSLAQQRQDWDGLADIADEALAKGESAEDRVEWIPLVMGYALTGRQEDAKPYGEILKTNEYLRFQACNYFSKSARLLETSLVDPEGLSWLVNEFCN